MSSSVVLPPTADFAWNDKERRKRDAPVRKEQRERGRLDDEVEARPVIFFRASCRFVFFARVDKRVLGNK